MTARLGHHAAAAAAGAALLPASHALLKIFGDQYACAWALTGAACWWHHRHPTLLALVLAWALLTAAVTDLPVVRATVTELTGVTW